MIAEVRTYGGRAEGVQRTHRDDVLERRWPERPAARVVARRGNHHGLRRQPADRGGQCRGGLVVLGVAAQRQVDDRRLHLEQLERDADIVADTGRGQDLARVDGEIWGDLRHQTRDERPVARLEGEHRVARRREQLVSVVAVRP
jgi:hypothetical protein